MGGFRKNRASSKWMVYNGKSIYKLMIWRYSHFRTPPFLCIFLDFAHQWQSTKISGNGTDRYEWNWRRSIMNFFGFSPMIQFRSCLILSLHGQIPRVGLSGETDQRHVPDSLTEPSSQWVQYPHVFSTQHHGLMTWYHPLINVYITMENHHVWWVNQA